MKGKEECVQERRDIEGVLQLDNDTWVLFEDSPDVMARAKRMLNSPACNNK